MAKASEVWMIDLGMVAKMRPCLLLAGLFPPTMSSALVTVLPHTTAVRGNRWELQIPKSFLKPGAFHLQQVQSVSLSRFEEPTRGPHLGRMDDPAKPPDGILSVVANVCFHREHRSASP